MIALGRGRGPCVVAVAGIAALGWVPGDVPRAAAQEAGAGVSADPVERFVDAAPPAEARFAYDRLAMLPTEGSRLADELAAHVAARLGTRVLAGEAAAVRRARRLVALALALDPRNRRAVFVNDHLARGLEPKQRAPAYAPDVFAQLLVERAKHLGSEAGAGEHGKSAADGNGADENVRLAGFLLALAVDLDPRNEDAVYAWEMHRLRHGMPDWAALTGPSPAP